MGRVVCVPHEHLVIVIFMRTSYLIERNEPDPRFPIPLSFFGTAEDFEKIGGGKLWNVKRFTHIEEPPFYGEPTPCNNIGDIWAIQRRIIKHEGEKLMASRVQHILKFMDFDKLTDWETKFMESIESHDKAGHALSERQIETLEKIFTEAQER